MSWQTLDYSFIPEVPARGRSRIPSSGLNEQCFIRKQHKCGKMYAASKSCFIACPTSDNLQPILELMSEKLSKLGVEPIIAVKDRAYGQDIFCTKICGKVIESRFCIVILDDAVRDGSNVPNPNVYYEYGLMTALGKHIIPLQRDDLKLAFNIQSYDTIKYSDRTVASELDRAIREAVKLTEAVEPEKTKEAIADKVIMRRMEMAGFQAKDDKWFLADAIDDTAFRGFGRDDGQFYVLLGKIDSIDDSKKYLDDLGLVTYRIEREARSKLAQITALRAQQEKPDPGKQQKKRSALELLKLRRAQTARREKIQEAKRRLALMCTIYVGFVVAPDLEISDFCKESDSTVAGNERYRLAYSQGGKIEFGGVTVEFVDNQH